MLQHTCIQRNEAKDAQLSYPTRPAYTGSQLARLALLSCNRKAKLLKFLPAGV